MLIVLETKIGTKRPSALLPDVSWPSSIFFRYLDMGCLPTGFEDDQECFGSTRSYLSFFPQILAIWKKKCRDLFKHGAAALLERKKGSKWKCFRCAPKPQLFPEHLALAHVGSLGSKWTSGLASAGPPMQSWWVHGNKFAVVMGDWFNPRQMHHFLFG